MNGTISCPEKTLRNGEKLNGFKVQRVEYIPEIRITAYDLEHEKTGAKLLHLHSKDRENLFSVGFRTPPKDSTGVPHILEHSVLAGSERYPVKDAFNELVKGTLQTFINAFTFPDKTVYPVASQIYTDFFNLARVYCDLVFKPRLLRETFSQEGYHLEFENPQSIESRLTISGIVFNEMKGAYSSPDSLMYKYIQEGLFPDNTYGFDSGGDPLVIPSLSYEALKAFHHTYYSPSNARFLIYGDIPTKDHLAFLEEVLAGFEKAKIDSRIVSQDRKDHPVRIHGYFPVGKDEELGGKTAINVVWMMAENTDPETVLILEILSEALVGSAAGPLRKALIDSGLGEDLSPVTGMVPDLKQVTFAVGLRGSEPERAGQVESIVMKTLQKLAETGIDREVVEGALHQIEFSGKEIIRKSMPYAIILLQRAYCTWLYEGDPLTGLNFPRTIESIRSRWSHNPVLFQEMIRKWFLDNSHRVVSIVEPSTTFTDEREEMLRAKMAALKAGLSPEKLEEIRTEAMRLRRMQGESDNPVALATLPRLKIKDIPHRIETIPTEEAALGKITVMKHDLFANGIVYLDLAFDVSDVPEDLQPYLPVLGKLMSGMGAAGFGYEEMSKRIALKTGGVGCHLNSGMTIDGRENWQKMIFSLKTLHRNIPEAVAIVRDLLAEADFSDQGRMRDLIMEAKNRLRSAVVPSGHLFAKRTAGSALSIPGYRDEQWNGRIQLQVLTEIADRLPERSRELLEKITFLYGRIFRKGRMVINLTGDSEGLSSLQGEIEKLIEDIQAGGRFDIPSVPALKTVNAGISIPAQVCYVAKVISGAYYKNELSAPLLVLSRFLSNNYLYKRIRVQGGAYGGMSQYDPLNGQFSFLSYRDPNLSETINVYEETLAYLKEKTIDVQELEKAIIGTIGQLDKPMDPASMGYTAMIRSFAGLSDSSRQEFRNRVIDVSPAKIMEAADNFLSPSPAASSIAVYAPHERLLQANEIIERKLKIESLT